MPTIIITFIIGIALFFLYVVICILADYLARASRARNRIIAREQLLLAERDVYLSMQRGDVEAMTIARASYARALQVVKEYDEAEV